jgi:hypothetical protein
MAKEKDAPTAAPAPESTGTTVPVVKWDDSSMSTTYANVCNVTGTREEVGLLFGTNQTLYTGQKEVTVKVTNRIVLSPYAAKRLQKLLENVIGQYEGRFGKLNIGVE